MYIQELLSLPVVVDLTTAGRAFGISRTSAYRLAGLGQLPVPVLRLGRRLVVTRAALFGALGVTDPAATPADPVSSTVDGQR